MGISPYLRRLRERIGHDYVLVPSVAVLARDADGRLLMVKESISGRWQTIGGAIDPDETPAEAAIRETREEAGVEIRLAGIRTVLGGPQFRLTYPNGDEVGYVPTVFDALVTAGTPRPDGEETSAVAWFADADLSATDLTPFTRDLLLALALLP